MKQEMANAIELIDFIYDSPCSYYAVKNIKKILKDKDFIELNQKEKWNIKKGKNYFLTQNDSSIFIFSIGERVESITKGLKIFTAHTDSPCLKIKTNPEIISEKKYMKINVELYGSPILNTWFDRPLSIAGRVMLKDENSFIPKTEFIKVDRPIFIIPNLAIHLDKNSNKEKDINPQLELLPLAGNLIENNEKDYFLNFISENINAKKEDILDYDLFLYEYEKGDVIGLDNEYISSSRIDNLQSVYAGLKAFMEEETKDSIKMLAFFDNEEIGSNTKQGADSNLLKNIIERIYFNLEEDKECFYIALANSIMISADSAHAFHPNYPEKYDITNKAFINNGIAVKYSAGHRYTTDAYSAALIKKVALSENIKIQNFANRSDQRGGSTLGPSLSAHLSMDAVDIGIPILAMHSIRELAGVYDHSEFIKLIKKLFRD